MKKFWHRIFPAFYGFLIYGTLRVVNDTMGKGFKFWERPLYINVIEFVSVIIVGYLFTYIIKAQERKYFTDDVGELTLKRAGKDLLSVIGIALLIVYCTIIPMAALTDDGLSLSDLVQITIIPTLYIVLYFAIRRGNFYIQAFVQSKIKLQQIENDRLNAELNFLKEQFSPHFLFNGLNNIYFLMDKSVSEAKKSVEKLSELLRYSLYQDQQKLVDISKEIEFIRLYADVHKLRKDDHLKLTMKFEEIEGKIYPHLLLPLVENAFKYAEGKNPTIKLKLFREGDDLIFTVLNSKHGKVQNDGSRSGIGLKNLRRRLELLYSGNYDLEANESLETYNVVLKLPIR